MTKKKRRKKKVAVSLTDFRAFIQNDVFSNNCCFKISSEVEKPVPLAKAGKKKKKKKKKKKSVTVVTDFTKF